MSSDVATDIAQHVAEEQQAPAEEMVPQSKVDAIVTARLAREREKAMASMGGMGNQSSQMQPQFDEEALLAKAAERMQQQMDTQRQEYERKVQTEQAEKIAEIYLGKMEEGKGKYPDFEEVTADFSPAAYPQVTVLASQHDNLADIMYELNKNPRKLVDLHVLALTNKQMAQKEMAKLSQSIKQNETAVANNRQSPQPLSKMKASTVAGQDTGKRTISDMRKDPRYRG